MKFLKLKTLAALVTTLAIGSTADAAGRDYPGGLFRCFGALSGGCEGLGISPAGALYSQDAQPGGNVILPVLRDTASNLVDVDVFFLDRRDSNCIVQVLNVADGNITTFGMNPVGTTRLRRTGIPTGGQEVSVFCGIDPNVTLTYVYVNER
jgi:hypothetical protein